MSSDRRKILLMITDAGGGHRGSAESLKAAIEREGLPWDVTIVNAYKTVWKRIEFARRVLGIGGEDVYNHVLRHDLIRTARALRWLARRLVRLQAASGTRLGRHYFERERPDLVVSLMPFVNDVYARALSGGRIPFGLLMTDLMDTRPFMWLTPGACAAARMVAVPCAEAANAAREMGVSEQSLVQSGLVIHPKYFSRDLRELTPRQARERNGLDPALFTVLIVMGGYGGPVIRDLVRQFESATGRWQVVACTGRNEHLKTDLDAMAPALRNRLVTFGFTLDLHILMRAADVVVTKPGPASIFECLAVGTPLVLDDEQTMPQEVPNARFVAANKLGYAVKRRREIFLTVNELASNPDQRMELQNNIRDFGIEDASRRIIGAMAAIVGP